MNVEKYLNTLGIKFEIKGNYVLFFTSVIDKEILKNNIDLLAKEMHMEVELQSDMARKNIRHPEIKLKPEEAEQILTEEK